MSRPSGGLGFLRFAHAVLAALAGGVLGGAALGARGLARVVR